MVGLVLMLAVAWAMAAGPLLPAQGRLPRPDLGAGARQGADDGLIRGVVTVWGTNEAVRGAAVTAFLINDSGVLMNPAAHQTVVTDEGGRFEFRDLPMGAWKVTASKTGYVTWQFGQRRPFEVPAPIVLSRGRERVAADFSVPRASAIAGRVYDELGDPASNVRITVYRARMVQGRRHLESVGRMDQTDDTGAYRIYGLAPGQYYLAASLRVAPADSVVDTTYAPTYYPGTGSLADARRIALEVGGEAVAEFQLLPVRRLRVAGAVFTSSGTPASAFLNLVSESSEFGVPLGLGGATRPDGSFTLPDVAPGRYTLYASLRGGEPAEAAEIPLTVAFDDVTGLTLVTARAGTIRGTFVRDSGTTRMLPRGIGVTARSFRAGGPMTGAEISGSTFEVAAPAGPFQLHVHGLPPEWMVQRIEIGGQDATDGPVAFGPGQDVAARIVLTDDVTEIGGTLALLAASATHVVVFPRDPAKWPNPGRYVRSAQADAQGGFRITGVPPGEYFAVAVDYLEEGEEQDPEFLSSVAPRAAGFSLADGESRTVMPPLVQR